ncbi:hypothetical protein H9660_11885 [Clostridium sp. Sa3CUN1]|uniref:Uncharacterized protein n=1 Tax=Clostridium gallinarum TaxID=2762246 RepID=A0ABR8Q5Z2_9CLOT|nr:hypothetical protein [Clostridium gallinarum]MBD7915845.1 hypothetical protein [Clostridium gallinarum]
MRDYKIFLSASNKNIEDKATLRVDLYGDIKIKDIEELKDFNIVYISKGHEETVSIKGANVPCKVRYIQVFKK